MRRIHGYVLVKETNQGVPNLVVCAYDSEAAVRDLVGEHPRTKVLTPSFIEKLGQRIGSVLTDKDGGFRLTAEDLQFEGIESRPDLLLLVLAPEDIVDPKRPYVLPPEQRLLYISSVPRMDAGADEAFIIRLLQAQLDTFAIPLNSEPTDAHRIEARIGGLLEDVERKALIRERIKLRFKPQVKEEYDNNLRLQKLVKENVKLSALPLGVREHPLLLKKPADLERLQKQVVRKGLNRLKDWAPELRLSLTGAELKSIGLTVKRDGTYSGKIETRLLADRMQTMLGGVDLIRKEEIQPSSVSLQALAAKYLTPVVESPTSNTEKTASGKPTKKVSSPAKKQANPKRGHRAAPPAKKSAGSKRES